MPIFCQKNVHSHENTLLSYHFFQKCHEKPSIVMPLFGQKKRQFCQNYTILWAKKVQRMLFSCYFSRKNYCSNAHVSKRRPFSKKRISLMLIFCRKNAKSLKNLSCHFLQILHEKFPAVMPIFDQKNVNSVKTTLYYGSKNKI